MSKRQTHRNLAVGTRHEFFRRLRKTALRFLLEFSMLQEIVTDLWFSTWKCSSIHTYFKTFSSRNFLVETFKARNPIDVICCGTTFWQFKTWVAFRGFHQNMGLKDDEIPFNGCFSRHIFAWSISEGSVTASKATNLIHWKVLVNFCKKLFVFWLVLLNKHGKI